MKNGEKPAMPIRNDLCPDEKPRWVDGMTKREYFAGLAMQGLMATPRTDEYSLTDVARESVMQADELLLELERQQ